MKTLMKRAPFCIRPSEEPVFITLKSSVLFLKYSHRIFFYIHISNLTISIYTFFYSTTDTDVSVTMNSSLFPDVLQL